jgi:hypothetical protein
MMNDNYIYVIFIILIFNIYIYNKYVMLIYYYYCLFIILKDYLLPKIGNTSKSPSSLYNRTVSSALTRVLRTTV